MNKSQKSFWKVAFPFLNRGISEIEKIILAKQLSISLKGGLDIVTSIGAIIEQTHSKKLKKVLKDIESNVSAGESLANSFKKYPDEFSPFFIDMIYAGEVGGTLPDNLEYISSQMEKEYDAKKQIKSAILYPAIVVTLGITLTIALSIFVLPKIIGLYDSFEIELPLISQILLDFTDFVSNCWLYILVFLFLLYLGYVYFKYNKKTSIYHDKLILKLPYSGTLVRLRTLSQVFRTLATLLESGVPIETSLEATTETTENEVYKGILYKARDAIIEGSTIHSVINSEPSYFPTISARMIELAEKTGNLEPNLFYLSEFYDKELENYNKNMTATLEPLITIFIGILVAFLAVAVIIPIYRLTGSIGRL